MIEWTTLLGFLGVLVVCAWAGLVSFDLRGDFDGWHFRGSFTLSKRSLLRDQPPARTVLVREAPRPRAGWWRLGA